MASLDKAFIKAYRQHGPAADAIPLDTSGTESLVEALEDRPLREAKKQTAVARHTGVLAALQTERAPERLRQPPAMPPGEPANKPANKSGEDTGLNSCNQAVPAFLRRASKQPCGRPHAAKPPAAGQGDKSARPGGIEACRLDAAEPQPAVPAPHIDSGANGALGLPGHAAAATPTATGPTDACATAACPSGVMAGAPNATQDVTSRPVRGKPAAAHPTDPAGTGGMETSAFRPLLQVERITASAVGDLLQQRAAAELDRLADALLAGAKKGRKVVGFASDSPGQGATTVLGSVALHLAARGVTVALVDGNLTSPQLATELGLLPEFGWERALEAPVPLEELVIESMEQPIALMPLCSGFDAANLPDDFAPFREALAIFRENYDLVLVDLGVPCDALMGRLLRTLDTVLLVRDARRTQSEPVVALHRALGRAGVNVAGIIESFVRGG